MSCPAQDVTYRQMLAGPTFYYGAEVVTTRGYAEPTKPNKLLELCEALGADPRIGWLALTDNAGGNPMLPPDALGRLLAAKRQVVLHLTCKDLNRNGLESAAWRCAAEGFHNILALTGDYPAAGYGGAAPGVFDLDSVALISLLHAMNQGLEVTGRTGKIEKLPATNFFVGCAVSPFKRHEREYMPQLFKLARKIRCGAQWVICQLGYDARKFQEVQLFLRQMKLDVPVIGNTYVLNKAVAGLFHKRQIPGCVVNDELFELAQKYSAGPDKGQSFFYELAARQLAIFKGLGLAAGYLAGLSKAEGYSKIIDLAQSYAPDDWKDFARQMQFHQPDEFYLFERDETTGLSHGEQVNRDYLASLQRPPRTANVTLGYRLSRKVHDSFFTPGKGAFDALRAVYQKLDAKGNTEKGLGAVLHAVEHAGKAASFGCRDCGDCSLPDCAYLCPRASCSKASRNGPCGGSDNGMCELRDKECLWARAYERLKYYGESQQMLEGPAVVYNASLAGTSSWANLYLGRDHHHAAGNDATIPPKAEPMPPAKPKEGNA